MRTQTGNGDKNDCRATLYVQVLIELTLIALPTSQPFVCSVYNTVAQIGETLTKKMMLY